MQMPDLLAVVARALLSPSSDGGQSRWTLAAKPLVPGVAATGKCQPGLALLLTLLEQAVLLQRRCHNLLLRHGN